MRKMRFYLARLGMALLFGTQAQFSCCDFRGVDTL